MTFTYFLCHFLKTNSYKNNEYLQIYYILKFLTIIELLQNIYIILKVNEQTYITITTILNEINVLLRQKLSQTNIRNSRSINSATRF